MAATASFDIGSYNPSRLRPGEAIKATDWAHLPGLINAGLAYASTGTVVSQSLEGGIRFSYDAALDGTTAVEWRIPMLTEQHIVARVRVGARVVWDGEGDEPDDATITFSCPGVDTAALAIPAGELVGAVAGDLEIAGSQDRSDYTIATIRMFIDIPEGELIELHSIDILIDEAELDQRINGAVPLDASGPMFGADAPLCAAAGGWMRGGIEATRLRPRPVLCWAAITPDWLANAIAIDADYEAFGAPPPGIGIRGLLPIIEGHGVAGHALLDEGEVGVLPFAATPAHDDEDPAWRSQHERALGRVVEVRDGLCEVGSVPLLLLSDDPTRALTLWTAEQMGEDLLQGGWQEDEL